MSVSGVTNPASALSAQIQSSALGRTLSGIVRSELPTIEAALQHGLRYEQLCQHLAALGVTVSPGTLRQTVYRLRRQQSRRGDDSSPASSLPASDTARVPATTSTLTPQLLAPAAAPVAPEPSLDRLAPRDTVPLMQVNHAQLTAQRVGPAPPTDFITAIRQSCPDLDVLAYRYRESQRHERGGGSQSVKTSAIQPASTADITPTSSSPGSTSS